MKYTNEQEQKFRAQMIKAIEDLDPYEGKVTVLYSDEMVTEFPYFSSRYTPKEFIDKHFEQAMEAFFNYHKNELQTEDTEEVKMGPIEEVFFNNYIAYFIDNLLTFTTSNINDIGIE